VKWPNDYYLTEAWREMTNGLSLCSSTLSNNTIILVNTTIQCVWSYSGNYWMTAFSQRMIPVVLWVIGIIVVSDRWLQCCVLLQANYRFIDPTVITSIVIVIGVLLIPLLLLHNCWWLLLIWLILLWRGGYSVVVQQKMTIDWCQYNASRNWWRQAW